MEDFSSDFRLRISRNSDQSNVQLICKITGRLLFLLLQILLKGIWDETKKSISYISLF